VTPAVRRQITRIGGEVLREIGVLLIVFAPLDSFFSRGTLTITGIAVIVVVAVSFILLGMVLGLER
jgi:hypothetical protein